MPSSAGSAATGAVSGASAGSVLGPYGAAAGAVIGGIGGYLSASGTADAQTAQNKQAAQQAAAQSAQSFYNYLSSRGINLQQLVASFPEFQNEWNRLTAAGQTGGQDFNTWLYKAINANQGHPIWNAIANPAGTAGAANTTLPAWAVDAQGNPLQPALLNQLLGINGGTNTPATAPIASIATLANAHAMLQANPEIAAELAAAGVGNDGRSPEQWLVDHITQTEAQSGGGTFTNLLRNFAVAQASGGNTHVATTGPDGGVTTPTPTTPTPTTPPPPGAPGIGNNLTLDPAITALLGNSTATVNKIFDGTFLNEVNGALKPVADARSAAAAAQLAKINEQRGLSTDVLNTELGGIEGVLGARTAGAGGIFDATMAGAGGVRDAGTAAAQGIYDANVDKLAKLLGVRREAAQQIYDSSVGAAGGVRDARTTGAKGIYDAESLRADTYTQAANQALSRQLGEQMAERARRGFTGGSSGSDITRARLMADYTQRGAGERANAGVNYAGRLSDAGVGYATDTGQAGIGRATTLGAAGEADAIAQLNAAVQRAQSLGLVGTNYALDTGKAGVTKATTLAGAGEQNAIAQLQAKVADAQRRLGYLTSDADIAKANADLANANDALNALVANQNRMTGSLSAPFQLAGADLSLKGSLSNQQYTDLDALLKRLGTFSTTPAGGPALTTPNTTSVTNNSQILGGTLTGLGSVLGNTSSNNQLADLIKLLGGDRTGVGAKTTYADFVKDNPGSSAAGGYLGIESLFAPH